MQQCNIVPLHSGRFSLVVQLGCKKYSADNLPDQRAAGAKIKAIVCEAILKYIAHRENALRRYHRLDLRRADIIQRLHARFADYKYWPAINLKPKVLGARQELLSLLPPANSRFYKNQVKLVTDIIALAESCHSADFVPIEPQ